MTSSTGLKDDQRTQSEVSDTSTTSTSEQPTQQQNASEKLANKQTKTATAETDSKYAAVVIVASLLVVFLVSLDRSIIATAIPRITDEFDSLNDIGWYGSAFLLTASCFQLLIGRIYTFYPAKYVFMVCITLFEVGSAICGAAPNSKAFILGRAVAGLGLAGIQNGGIAIVIPLVPLPKRPVFQGFFGAVLGLGQVVGPLIGGALTSDVSWRWCFYINLPVGGLAIVVLLFVLRPAPAPRPGLAVKEQLKQLDLLGELFLFPSIVCLLLALQWGGSTYSWSNGRVIALLFVFAVCLIGFVLVQICMQKTATIPKRVVKNRSIVAAMFMAFGNGASFTTVLYYVPVWFQAIKNNSAKTSGVHLIPMVLSVTLASIFAGIMTKKIGYYTPFAIAGALLSSIGTGLISTWTVDTGMPRWIGYQVVFGLGVGMVLQQPNLTAQTVLEGKDVQIGVSLVMLHQLLGGAVFVSVAQAVLDSSLIHGLQKAVKGGITPAMVVGTGATELRNIVPKTDLPSVLVAYNHAIRNVFVVCICLTCLSFVGAATLEWRSVKGKQGPTTKKPDEEEGTGEKSGAS
ncbi:uncharacterized protein LTR77_005063 [Saxophila tyrrhenica]|uniref:Major facilitator superfamily (MFS) profile domain-containing protein n=1 Tax=Saxophila tyrrhenica TaxID=1690608 RepID=A0AAV9PF77_9PEZI|nr:hypothetical protein LTR77_005063 [Saxophila tyrrhenica]